MVPKPLITRTMKTLVALVMVDFALMTAAQSSCDPQTQYEKSGQCCQMCPPGTRMSVHSTCMDPHCSKCGEDEYQDKHNTEPKCQRQPYCDANRNFQRSTQENKKKRLSCQCLLGFHCSSETCLTCVPHTTCKPGEGAVVVGNHTHDTVCQMCPVGSFSTTDSWESVCIQHTVCENGYEIEPKGTATSDNVCVSPTRKYIVLIIGLPVLVIVLIILAFFVCAKRKKKSSLDITKESYKPVATDNGFIRPPEDDPETALAHYGTQFSQEESSTRTPEENIDEGSREEGGADSGVYTQNGNYLKQETGKEEILSLQEESPTPPPHDILSCSTSC